MVTTAAVIMVAVFGGFAMGQLSMFQQMGFGLAVAVVLDASVIRSILVPASMRLLGDLNWYFPSWLEWLPKISVDYAIMEPAAREAGEAGRVETVKTLGRVFDFGRCHAVLPPIHHV